MNNNVFDYLLNLRSKGYLITFDLNDYGRLTIKQGYNEYIDGRKIYEIKHRRLAIVNLDEVNNSPFEMEELRRKIDKNLIPDNRINY